MNLFGSQLGSFYDNRIGLLEDKANQFASDLNYGKSDLIRNSRNSAYIEQLPDDEDENIKPFKFAYDDGIDVTQTGGSDFFRNAGNDQPFEEDDPVVRTFTQSPMHETSLSDIKANRPTPETPVFESTDVYAYKTPSVFFKKNEKGEPQQEIEEEKQSTPKKSKNIIGKGIKDIAQYFSPTNKKEEESSALEICEPVGSPPCIQTLWNKNCGALSRCKALSEKRKRAWKKCWKGNPDLGYWENLIRVAALTPFCVGKNDRKWFGDLDWFLREQAQIKLLEGGYGRPQPHAVEACLDALF
jgi:hypothetical protein